MSASLKGIRVLEMAQIMAGPTCGLLLADLGAEVIKIEKTPGGDDTRNFLPPDIKGESADSPLISGGRKFLVSSPPGVFSILITSAPKSANRSPQVGPAII